MNATHINIILVHGAWADGGSWNAVTLKLEQAAFKVVCAPLPLRSLSDDIQSVQNIIGRTKGPVALVGHAYAGAVIGGVEDARVGLLIYVAALAPDEGETVAEVFYRDPAHPKRPNLNPDAHGDIWLPDEGFGDAFAPEATAETLTVLRATQRPICVACIQEKAPRPAWKKTPVWFLIAEHDRMINPRTQHFMAERMKATVRSKAVDHTPLVTAADVVADTITEAVRATFASAA
jgi:pimeloyl-ACP methyl ester carboxylesterase